MKEKFWQFISAHKLLSPGKPALLAVSGGVDSMVMMHLFHECNLPFAVAHANFQLRAAESNEDELFVRSACLQMDKTLYVKKFETLAFAREQHLSVQTAARRLRYSWFEELLQEHAFGCIATAHHSDDDTETFFINLMRGTGIKGLAGIPVKQGNVIRPMLFCSRAIIEEYATRQGISWRSDSSNDEIHYLRNQVRHTLIPVIRSIQPQFDAIMERNLERIAKENSLLQQMMDEQRSKVLRTSGNETRISISELLKAPDPEYLLLTILEPFGFSHQQVNDVRYSLNKQPGLRFETSAFRLLRDRDDLIITSWPEENTAAETFTIETGKGNQHFSRPGLPFALNLIEELHTHSFQVDYSENSAQLDLERLQSPLILRKWKAGDSIQPLGMRGSKKVSDLLTDHKLSLLQKENCWVLCSGKDIVWVTGIRMSEKYKVRKSTNKVLTISLLYI